MEMKAFKNPPALLKLVLAGCAILFEDYFRKSGMKAIFYPQKGSEKKEMNWEEMTRKYLLSNPAAFVEMIVNFDKDNVSKKTIEKLHKVLFSNTDISADNLKKISSTAPRLYLWIKSVY